MDKPTLVDQHPVFLEYLKGLSLQDWGWVLLSTFPAINLCTVYNVFV